MNTPIWLESASTFRQSHQSYTNGQWSGERLYFQGKHLRFVQCSFLTGESALKECADIRAEECTFEGKYPVWNTRGVLIDRSTFGAGARAGIWYSSDIVLSQCQIMAPKLLRECTRVTLEGCRFGDSFETGWHSSHITMRHCLIGGNYSFMHASDVLIEDSEIVGQYALQYAQRVTLRRCTIDSKDILWHAQHATVEDCIIRTEYLAWHSSDVTFVNCTLEGPQPLCYSSDVRLRNCSLPGADRSFEYSSIDVVVDGHIDSVLNPLAGLVACGSIDIVLQDDPYIDHSQVRIVPTKLGGQL